MFRDFRVLKKKNYKIGHFEAQLFHPKRLERPYKGQIYLLLSFLLTMFDIWGFDY